MRRVDGRKDYVLTRGDLPDMPTQMVTQAEMPS